MMVDRSKLLIEAPFEFREVTHHAHLAKWTVGAGAFDVAELALTPLEGRTPATHRNIAANAGKPVGEHGRARDDDALDDVLNTLVLKSGVRESLIR
jgi:hypothetical protein